MSKRVFLIVEIDSEYGHICEIHNIYENAASIGNKLSQLISIYPHKDFQLIIKEYSDVL